jgi:ABC-2 type transport system permease protein
MNPQPNAVPDSSNSQRTNPLTNSRVRPLYWSIRRELWESRAVYIAPVAVAGVFLLGFLLYLHKFPADLRFEIAAYPEKKHPDILMQPFDFAAAAVMGIAFLVGLLYCIEALNTERRDRSILFWKSLPVSDLTVVLSKASIPFLVVPAVCYGITFVLQSIMLVLSSLVLSASGLGVSLLWNTLNYFPSSFYLLYHIFTVHVLWYAPIYGWLLLISAWARRAPLVWAVIPPLAIGIFERLVFHTSYFGQFIGSRFSGGPEMDTSSMDGGFPFHHGVHLTPGNFLMSPGLWIGLLFTAVFLFAAARIRRYREPV